MQRVQKAAGANDSTGAKSHEFCITMMNFVLKMMNCATAMECPATMLIPTDEFLASRQVPSLSVNMMSFLHLKR